MKLSQFATVPFSIVLIIFTTQAINIQISKLSNLVTNSIQALGITPIVQMFILVLNYVLLPALVLAYLYFCFLVKAKIIQNLSAIIFISTSFFLVNVLKLIFAELRPKMSAILSEIELNVASCEMDFGMPSGYIFMSVCFGYLIRRNFFVVKSKTEAILNVDGDLAKPNDDKFEFSERHFTFKDCRRFIINHELRFNYFNIFFFAFVVLTVICKMLVGSHTITQSLLTVIIAIIWSTFYYNFIELGIKSFNRDLILAPQQRGKSVAAFALLTLACFVFDLFLYLSRRFIYDYLQLRKIRNYYLSTCPPALFLSHSNFYYALTIFFPLYVVLLLYFTPFRPSQYEAYTKRMSFEELTRKERVTRIIIWLVPMVGMYVGYILMDQALSELKKDLFWLKCIIFLAYQLLVAFMLVLGFPYMFMKTGVLLKNEYIYKKTVTEDEEDGGEKKKVKIIVKRKIRKTSLETNPAETARPVPTTGIPHEEFVVSK